jgi:glycosyltransferase involved in cell wall biosynthesis
LTPKKENLSAVKLQNEPGKVEKAMSSPDSKELVGSLADRSDNGLESESPETVRALGDDNRLTIVIPAYNEGRTIKQVLDRILEFIPDLHEVIIVDDASTDNTAGVCESYSRRDERIKLIRNSTNRGKTAALREGFAQCSGAIVVVQDADLEYDPRDIPELISPIREGKADVCLGSRFMIRRAGRVLYYRHYLANKFLTFASNVLTDLNLTDVETGYKAMRSEIAKNLIIESAGFGFEIEVIAKCKKIGARIFEVPISYYGRTYEEGKKITFIDGLHAIWYVFKFNLLRRRIGSFRKEFFQSQIEDI